MIGQLPVKYELLVVAAQTENCFAEKLGAIAHTLQNRAD